MATYCALHLRTTELDRVIADLGDWLRRAHDQGVSVEADQHWPDVYGDAFCVELTRPTLFAVGRLDSHWVIAHFNCFSDMANPAAELSERFAAPVVVINAQSTSDAYLLAVYDGGATRRVLESGDGLTRNEGEPFAFEGEIFGIDDDELPPTDEWAFGADELEALCARLGLRVWDHPEASDGPQHWSVIRVATGVRPRWLARLSERLGLRR